MYSMLLGICDM
jgi:hypothetical protein